jgi:hypothetical protein
MVLLVRGAEKAIERSAIFCNWLLDSVKVGLPKILFSMEREKNYWKKV